MAALTYPETVSQWRAQHQKTVSSETGWLSYAGLFWLKEGENRAGSGPDCNIMLPKSAPRYAGLFLFHAGKTQFRSPAGVVREAKSDAYGPPDIIEIAGVKVHVVKRGTRFGIRMRDPNSDSRRNFKGLKWYPVKEPYCVTAKFVAYTQPKKVRVTNILGDVDEEPSPGYAVFELLGKKMELEPVQEGDQLFYTFKDLTSGKTTYPAVRFLYSDLPKKGRVVLDFNLAHNPACAFTRFATCPLPPRKNYLPVAIEAGELYSHCGPICRRMLRPPDRAHCGFAPAAHPVSTGMPASLPGVQANNIPACLPGAWLRLPRLSVSQGAGKHWQRECLARSEGLRLSVRSWPECQACEVGSYSRMPCKSALASQKPDLRLPILLLLWA